MTDLTGQLLEMSFSQAVAVPRTSGEQNSLSCYTDMKGSINSTTLKKHTGVQRRGGPAVVKKNFAAGSCLELVLEGLGRQAFAPCPDPGQGPMQYRSAFVALTG